MYLSKTLYPLLINGSTQEDRKTFRHDSKFAVIDWGVNHQHKQIKTN